tara:strand:- start:3631 stop:3879 length:249 start_codon:yes stop_codon:yes gene_type:complete
VEEEIYVYTENERHAAENVEEVNSVDMIFEGHVVSSVEEVICVTMVNENNGAASAVAAKYVKALGAIRENKTNIKGFVTFVS